MLHRLSKSLQQQLPKITSINTITSSQSSLRALSTLSATYQLPHICSPACSHHSSQLLHKRHFSSVVQGHPSGRESGAMSVGSTDAVTEEYELDEHGEYFTDDDGHLDNIDPVRGDPDPETSFLGSFFLYGSIITYGSFFILYHYKPNDSPRLWAREEALSRGVFVPPLRPDLKDDEEED